MLPSDQVVEIYVDVVTGRTPKIEGAEADGLRKSIEVDAKMAKEKGWVMEIPSEWTELDEGDIEVKSGEPKEKGGQGSGNFAHAGRVGERGGSASSDSAGAEGAGEKFLKGDRETFVKDLKDTREKVFIGEKSAWDERATHNEQMKIFFGIDWIGQDQSGSILKLQQMVAMQNGSVISDKDIVDVFSKMRPSVDPMLGLMVMQMGFTGIDDKGNAVDRSQGFFSAMQKEKEFSERQFTKVFGEQVEVYKGVSAKYSDLVAKQTDGIKVKDLPLSSYSIDKSVAKEFAGKGGFVLSRTIKAEDAWFGVHSHESFSSEFGKHKLGEGEIVVGNKSPHTIFDNKHIEKVK
jgi:hypothetical protein